MEKNIFVTTLIKKTIIIKSRLINKNLESNILEIVKDTFGDKCIDEGYVKKDSIHIVKRSLGTFVKSNFSGYLKMDVVLKVDVCNPVRGNIVNCTIEKITRLGILASNPPLSIVISKDSHNNKDLFKNITLGQVINVLIIGKKYDLGGKVIEIFAKFSNDTPSPDLDINDTPELSKPLIQQLPPTTSLPSPGTTTLDEIEDNEDLLEKNETDEYLNESDDEPSEQPLDEPDEIEEIEDIDENNVEDKVDDDVEIEEIDDENVENEDVEDADPEEDIDDIEE